MIEFFESIKGFDIEKDNVSRMSPLVLAYIGDIVYEVYIRTIIVCENNIPVNKLHAKSVKFVSAKAQSFIMEKLQEVLSNEELNIFKRGRNAKSGTMPKNVNVNEYKYATGFEALLGFLYLQKNYSRLSELIKLSVDVIK